MVEEPNINEKELITSGRRVKGRIVPGEGERCWCGIACVVL